MGTGRSDIGAGEAAAADQCFTFLRSVPILYEIDDRSLQDIAATAEARSFEPGERVIVEGQREEFPRFYVIRSGSADVLRRNRAGVERVVARLTLGSYFGELGLLTDQARNATVRVHGDLPLRAYVFDTLAFHGRIVEHVLVFRVLRERARQRRAGGPSALPPARLRVRELDLLQELPGAKLDVVMGQAEQRWYAERSLILRQGDVGDRFHILLEGTVEVERDGEHVETLRPGDFFGETALLLDTPRTATVRASAHALTWSITRSAFQRIIRTHLLSNVDARQEILRRLHTAGGDSQMLPTLPRDDQ